MCGRIARGRDHYAERYGVEELSELRSHGVMPAWMDRYNIAPTQLDVIIRPTEGGRELVASRWGLVPVWAKDRSVGAKTFNARVETLIERPTFKNLVSGHRCIIPASGFYEWRSEGKRKQPLYVHRADGDPLALAGLWSEWTDPESGEPMTSHTVITTAANGVMAPINNRMPVILDGEALDLWLDPSVRERGDVLPLLGPAPDDLLTAYPVAPLVNNVRNDGPELIAPLEG